MTSANAHTCLSPHGSLDYVCTRPRGHQGQHVAHDDDGATVRLMWTSAAPTSVEGILDSLATAHRDTCRAITRRDRLVGEARRAGATWSQVGATLGISAQGAQKRYGTGQERQQAHDARQAARKAARAARAADAPTSADPWPDGTVQGTI